MQAGPVVTTVGPVVSSIHDMGLGPADPGLAILLAACERAVEDVGATVPPAQLRALLVIEKAGSLNLNQLARILGASASATSRLCDRMQAAGLVTRDRAAASRREIVLLPSEAGHRLAEWVRSRRQVVLSGLLAGMTAEGAQALVRGLAELAAAAGQARTLPA
jgi:DNA-binding MarR family transcriptional regulator